VAAPSFDPARWLDPAGWLDAARTAGRDARPASALRAAWSPGALSRAHAYTGDRCEVCHAEPFARVTNGACLDCHASAGAHVASGVSLASGGHVVAGVSLAGRAHDACTACHVDHRGAFGAITYSDAMCSACHADLSAHAPATALDDVASWSEHPQFRPSVVVDAQLSLRERVPAGAGDSGNGAVERSGLIFSHRTHVFPGPVSKVALACERCHVPDASGATMRSVRFAEHCQGCHALRYDDSHPEHQVPHVAPDRVAESLDVFYAWVALNGLARDPAAPPPARRRPGREMTEAERAGALGWAHETAAAVGRRLLSSQCATCHFVTAAEPAGAATSDMRAAAIAPVRVVPLVQSDAWMPKARFSHRAHGETDCEHCHDVRYVRNAEAVMLPAVEACRQCHATEAAAGKVASACVDCHVFHRDDLGPIDDGVHASAAGSGGAEVSR
jgi:hypothetical protein